MTTTKTPVPPVNLKDRIAALQQRAISPTNHPPELGPPGPTSVQGRIPSGNSLKDKIANFERKGAVPVPRGRFGTSAPPPADGSSKKRGELYGNRVPELAKPSPQAVLSIRKRTVSTSDGSSYTRPTSPVSPASQPLVGDPLPLDLLDSRLPPAITPAGRRAVSDVLPRSTAALGVDEPLPEAENEAPSNLSGTLKHDDPSPPPVIIAEPASPPRDNRAAVDVPEAPQDDAPIVEPPAKETQSKPISSVPQEKTTPSLSTEELALNVEIDNASVLGETTASSESVPTPSDNVSFDTSKVITKDARENDGLSPIVEQESILVKPEAPIIMPSQAIPSPNPTTLSPDSSTSIPPRLSVSRMSTSESVSTLDTSLAVDTGEPVIIREPLKIISPRVARAVLVPAPSPSSPSLAQAAAPAVKLTPIPTPTSAATPVKSKPVPASLPVPSINVPQPSTPAPESPSPQTPAHHSRQPSFRVVVHGKVREGSPEAAQESRKRVPDFPPPRTPSMQRVSAQAPPQPDSPGLGDLAALMADAALLEEQLANSRTPKKPTPPMFNVQPAIPEASEPKQPELRMPGGLRTESSSEEGGGLFVEPPHPSSHLRSRTESAAPATPPKDNRGSRIFSSLRVRKQSMPGTYPRTSVCSEISTDSSFPSRPTTPPQHGQDMISDTSSIRSSSKSWKSPKKGINRASSWLFRARAKSNPVIEEHDPQLVVSEPPLPPVPSLPPLPPLARSTSPSLLSPTTPTAARPHSMAPGTGTRPTSWLSVSSAGSGDVSSLFDAFPSVPEGAADLTRSATTVTRPSNQHGATPAVGRANSVAGWPARRT